MNGSGRCGRESSPTALTIGIEGKGLLLGVAQAQGVRVGPSGPPLVKEIEDLCGRISKGEAGIPDPVRAGIRRLLRHGRYRPSGRSKPASEYLLGLAAKAGMIDLVNNIVDVNNYISLRHGLPASVFDLDLVSGALQVRHGRPGESYVFNPSGQVIDLEDLILCADQDGLRPIGTPVKDSMATKIRPETRRVLAVVYSSREVSSDEDLAAVSNDFALCLTLHAGAASAHSWILRGASPGCSGPGG